MEIYFGILYIGITKTERMKMMNSFSKIEVNKKKEPIEALMREPLEPLIITTRKKIYIPEKRIIIMFIALT